MNFEQAYAAAGKVKHGSYYAMQDMTSEICDNVTVPSEQSTATLVDIRDSKTYTVAKLKDGRCWMTQNLRIGSNGSTILLTPDSSDISTNYTLPQGTNTYINDPETAHLYIDSTYGGYYSWSAAVAGSKISTGTATSSICPKSWKLPDLVSAQELLKAYTSEDLRNHPANFVYGATLNLFCASNYNQGFYWLSTSHNEESPSYAHHLFLTGSGKTQIIDCGSCQSKQNNMSVRCVSRM